MPNNKFSIRESLKFGWNTAINHIGFFVVALLLSWVAMMLPHIIGAGFANDPSFAFLTMLFSLLGVALGIAVGIGFIKSSLALLDGREAGYEDFRPTSREFVNFLGASVLAALAILIGFVLLVVPGIILSIALRFYPFFIIDKKMGPVEALKASYEATKGSRWRIFLLLIVDGGVVFLGAIALLVGLFVAIPTVLMSQAYVYRKLAAHGSGPAVEVA